MAVYSWIILLIILAFLSAGSAQSLNIRNKNTVSADFGKRTYLTKADLRIKSTSSYCRMKVLDSDKAIIGRLTPPEFPCNFKKNSVFYEHFGHPAYTSDVLNLLVTHGSREDEQILHPISLPIELKQHEDSLLSSPISVEVRDLRSHSTPLPDVDINSDKINTECTFSLVEGITNWPRFGNIANISSVIQNVPCDQVGRSQIKYRHTALQTPDHDFLQGRITLKDKDSGNITDVEYFMIKVIIREGVENQPPTFSDFALLQLTVPQFVMTAVQSNVLAADDDFTESDELYFAVDEDRADYSGTLVSTDDQTLEITTFFQSDIKNLKIAYRPPEEDSSEDRIYKIPVYIMDNLGVKSDNTYHLVITVKSRDTNAPIITLKQPLQLVEGSSATLTSDNIRVSDEDTLSGQIMFHSVSGLKHGQLHTPRTDSVFTLTDLTSGLVSYQHDHSDTSTDNIILQISDGKNQIEFLLPIIVFPVDDSHPSLIVNTGLRLYESTTIPVSNLNLRAVDSDSVDDSTIYVMVSPRPSYGVIVFRDSEPRDQRGWTELAQDLWEKVVTQWTQSDIDKGRVFYKQSVPLKITDLTSSIKDKVKFRLRDTGSPPNVGPAQTFNVEIITLDNTPPTLIEGQTLHMTVQEGQITPLSEDILSYRDDRGRNRRLTYEITDDIYSDDGLDSGVMVFTSDPSTPVLMFTQADVNEGRVSYKPAEEELGLQPRIVYVPFIVIDESHNSLKDQSLTIFIHPVNDELPTVTVLPISVFENGYVVITPSILDAVDVDTRDEDLTFTLSREPEHAHIKIQGAIAGSGDIFTKSDIMNGRVVYLSTGGDYLTDSFQIQVSDGKHVIPAFIRARITLIDDGVISLEEGDELVVKIEVNEGGVAYITPKLIQATTHDDNVATFTLSEQPIRGIVTPTEFTYDDIEQRRVRYTVSAGEIGSEAVTDRFNITVTDGQLIVADQTIPSVYFHITILPVDNKKPVVSVGLRYRVEEGGVAPILPGQLSVIDVDTPPSNVVCTIIGQPQYGFLELSSPAAGSEIPRFGLSITAFTVQDLNQAHVHYRQSVHQGLEPKSDSLSLQCSDNINAVGDPVMFNISINPKRDEIPEIHVNNFVVEEGRVLQIDLPILNVIDRDMPPDLIRFKILRMPVHGMIYQSSITGGAREITEFNFDDIRSMSKIAYAHDNSETTNDSFSLQVTDGTFTAEKEIPIRILPVDDEIPQIILNKGLYIEAQIAGLEWSFITHKMLKAEDLDSVNENITYKIRQQPVFGFLQRRIQTEIDYWDNITRHMTFQQWELDEIRIRYVHNGRYGVRDVIKLDLSDPARNVLIDQRFYITVESQDRVYPEIVNRGVQLPQSQSVIITTDMLNAYDDKSSPESLIFNVTEQPRQGFLELVTKPGQPLTSFTQVDLAAGRVRYTHESSRGRSLSDAFTFEVTDGWNPIARAFTITLNPVDNEYPVLSIQPIRLREKGFVYITPNQLMASDVDTDPEDIVFTISQMPLFGSIFLSGKETRTFTAADLEHGRVQYKHSGEESMEGITIEDGFSVKVSDGTHSRYYVSPDLSRPTRRPVKIPIFIHAVDDYVPQLIVNNPATYLSHDLDTNKLSFTITTRNLLVEDMDTRPQHIMYWVIDRPLYGRLVNSEQRTVNSFSQADIDTSRIRYELNDGVDETTDQFTFRIQDSGGNSADSALFSLYWSYISFGESALTFNETQGVGEVKVSRTGNTKTPAYVSVRITDGTTRLGQDYSAQFVRQIQFNPGQYESVWRLPIIDDSIYEMKEMLSVELVDPVNSALSRQEWISISIIDTEDTPIVSLIHIDEGIRVQETVGRASIQLNRTGDLSQEVVAVCDFYTDGESIGTGEPAAYTDFIMRSSAVRFVQGQSLAECYVDINDDTYIEPDESFTVNISKVEGGTIGLYNSTKITILADSQDLPTIKFQAAEYLVSEGAGSLSIEIKRSGADLNIQSQIMIVTQRVGENQAEPMSDYIPVSSSLRFLPGEMMKQVKVRILDDRVMPMMEGRETFALTLRFPQNASLGNPNKTTITIKDETDVPEYAFAQLQYTVTETNQSLTAVISRYGDTTSVQKIRCRTQALTARPGLDFIPSDNQITFKSGEIEKPCIINIIDDEIYESDERFRIIIEILPNNTNSNQDGTTPTRSTSAAVVVITDDEDKPVLRFSDSHVYVSEPERRGNVNQAKVTVIRDGDVSQTSAVRIYTREGTAKSGIDYIDIIDQLEFSPGVRERQITIDVLYDGNAELRESIAVFMSSDSYGTAQIATSRTSVYISDENSLTGLVFPVAPVVMSLKSYNTKMSSIVADDIPNGYPLICVTPCDRRHPSYVRTRYLCESEEIDNSLTQYRWKVGESVGRDGIASDLQPLVTDTFMTSTTTQTLDSIYFTTGSRIKCLATAASNSIQQGIEIESSTVTISQTEGVCKPQRAGFHGGDPYLSKVKYLGADHKKYPHHIKLSVTIPHRDGMIPALSTEKLSNFDFMLSRDASRIGLHRCSNLVQSSETDLKVGWKDQKKADEAFLPYQHEEDIRGENTVKFYSNLDMENCVWEFNGYFKLHELINTCGAKIETNSQVEDLTKSYVSVVIPLYVSYVFHSISLSSSWRHYDLSSKQRITFVYDTALLLRQGVTNVQSDSGTDTGELGDLSGRLYLESVRILPSGKMSVDFVTYTNFYGQFLLKRGDDFSQVTTDDVPNMNFNLELLTSQDTYDNPKQEWRFTTESARSDYTGRYTVSLLPCISPPNTQYGTDTVCATSKHLEFHLDVELQQVSDPVAEVFSLNAELTLTRDKRSWLNRNNAPEALADVSFKAGEKIYGRVETKNIQSDNPVDVLIEKVYICAGKDGFVPVYKPDTNQYGCVTETGSLAAQYKILDATAQSDITPSLEGIPFNAKLARDDNRGQRLYNIPGLDGFYFDSKPLLANGQKWFVHVIYSVDDLTDPLKLIPRYRRAAELSVLYDLNGVGSARGTNMAFLFVEDYEPSDSLKLTTWDKYSWVVAVTVVVVLLVVVSLLLAFIAKKIHAQSRHHNSRNSVTNNQRSGPECTPFPVNNGHDDGETTANEHDRLNLDNDAGCSEA